MSIVKVYRLQFVMIGNILEFQCEGAEVSKSMVSMVLFISPVSVFLRSLVKIAGFSIVI